MHNSLSKKVGTWIKENLIISYSFLTFNSNENLFQTGWDRGKKDWQCYGCLKTPDWTSPEVKSNKWQYCDRVRRGHPQRLSPLCTEMGRGPPLQKLCGHIVQQFKNNIFQCVIKSNLGILPSIACNIINTLWQSVEIFWCKGQEMKSTLNAFHLWSLWWQKYSMYSNTTWSQDHFDPKFKYQHLWWYKGMLVPIVWVTRTSFIASLMLKCVFYQGTSMLLLLEQWQAEHLRAVRL